jgi:hypothetical protein
MFLPIFYGLGLASLITIGGIRVEIIQYDWLINNPTLLASQTLFGMVSLIVFCGLWAFLGTPFPSTD